MRVMNGTKYVRNLRIAFSVTCGIAAVSFVVLWVLSYWSGYSTNRRNSSSVMTSLVADSGTLYFLRMDLSSRRGAGLALPAHGWDFQVDSLLEIHTSPHFAWNSSPIVFLIQVPIWFLVLSLTVLAAIPWVSMRFSLRTLLNLTAVVAVLLGMIITLGL
jgi:hypothetical protein